MSEQLPLSLSKAGVIVDNTSDHFPIITEIANPCVTVCEPECYITCKIGDQEINKISTIIKEINWEDRLTNKTANEAFNDCHDTLQTLIDKISPVISKIKQTKRVIPWLTDAIKKSIRRDKVLHKKSLLNKNINECNSKYLEYHKVLLKVKCNAKRNYYKNLCLEYKHDSKKIWTLINKISGKTNDKVELIEKIKVGSILEYNQKEISESLVNHFATLGERFANDIGQPNIPINKYLSKINRNPSTLFLSPTDKHEIDKLISSLPNKKNAGYDKINNVLLKELCPVIVGPLSLIFNKSLLEGTFPTQMKLAEMVPLYKAKEKYLVDNYCPISLLLTLSKPLEKL